MERRVKIMNGIWDKPIEHFVSVALAFVLVGIFV